MATKRSCLDLDEMTNYSEVVVNIGKVTFGEKARNNMKDSNLRKEQVRNLSQAACALLNSGGGVIKAEIENTDYSYKEHGIGQDIEKSLLELIPSRMFQKYFDCMREKSYFFIFVKSWSSEVSTSSRICSLTTGLFRRSVTRTDSMSPNDAAQFLKEKESIAKKPHDEETGPRAKKPLLDDVQQEQNMNSSAKGLYDTDFLLLGEKLNFTESTHVEFKQFAEKNIVKRTKEMLPNYISAFANTEGGFLFIGVDDNGTVVGVQKDKVNTKELEEVIEDVKNKLPISHFCSSQPDLKLEYKMLKVYAEDQNLHGYVCAMNIQPFCCVVFSATPDSWTVKDQKIMRMTVQEWVDLMVATDPEISNLCETLTELSVSCKPPLTKAVFSNKDLTCVRDLQKSLFPVNDNGITYKPDNLSKELFSEHPGLEDLIEKQIEELQCSQGLLIFERSWAVSIGLSANEHVVCDALLIAADRSPTLYTVTENCSEAIFGYSRSVARMLKQKLVNDGGYTQKLCVIPQLLHYGPNRQPNNDLCVQVRYPHPYVLLRSDMSDLLHSLVIILLSFRSFLSDQLGCEFFNLLTLRQYEILRTNLDKSKKLFIYGLPGTGKTIVALNIIERIKNEFCCKSEEILYICENQPLKAMVRDVCQSVTRVAFLKGNYPSVKHIVIDEAQNFRTEDGDWYAKVQCITQGNGHCKPGVLWIFLDYLQTSHPFPCGLPDPSAQEPQEWLTTVVRNATQIYSAMRAEMENIIECPQIEIPCDQLKKLLIEAKCGHSLRGVYRVKENMKKDDIATYVVDNCFQYFQLGYSGKDIAILCNTQNEKRRWYGILLSKMREKMRKFRQKVYFTTADFVRGNRIVLDSIRRFSGLERTIVFGINPVPMQKEISDNLKLCVASRANLHLHLLYEM
uniref:Schlafen family member 13 n=1 Tax=Pelusios castaneus TaxID=367368 RepID=A0A8C8S7J9_9SAUR